MVSKFFGVLFSAHTVLILSLVNLVISTITMNIPAICGWLVAAMATFQFIYVKA